MADFIPLEWTELSPSLMLKRGVELKHLMAQRRTTRHFSSKPVPRALIECAIECAGSAPSGAHLQPWTWVAISNKEIQTKLRQAAEQEERLTYERRMPEAWREVLEPLGTDAVKEHLTTAPWVVVLFKHKQRIRSNGERGPTYYATESCGIAAGFFLQCVHSMGLVALTHTPSPMKFLNTILNRPSHEEAMLVIPLGYPADDALVPNIQRKTLDEIAVFVES